MGALGCSQCNNKQEANNTRMRPTHGRSRLCGCVSMFCFHPLQYLFLFSTNQRLDWFAVFLALSVLTSSVLLSFDGFAFFVLHFRNAGPSRRRVEQANLYGLCFAISPEPSCEPRPHISETYQLIGRIEEARQWLRTAAFGCLESSK